MVGNIHSTETFGTVDGPGVRYVIFTQGCPLRCQYCHNPDTWKAGAGKERSVSELLSEYEKNKVYYKNGGITVTGGEPLLQLDFLTALFEESKKRRIHTCLDTSGITFQEGSRDYLEKLDRLLQATDLILLDIKHIDEAAHKDLTSLSNQPVLKFARYLSAKNIPVWIRHVVVPGITDKEDSLYRLGRFIGTLKNVKALDILPYHSMGISKYEGLGIPYPLKDTPDGDKEEAIAAKRIILRGIKDERK